LSEVYT